MSLKTLLNNKAVVKDLGFILGLSSTTDEYMPKVLSEGVNISPFEELLTSARLFDSAFANVAYAKNVGLDSLIEPDSVDAEVLPFIEAMKEDLKIVYDTRDAVLEKAIEAIELRIKTYKRYASEELSLIKMKAEVRNFDSTVRLLNLFYAYKGKYEDNRPVINTTISVLESTKEAARLVSPRARKRMFTELGYIETYLFLLERL